MRTPSISRARHSRTPTRRAGRSSESREARALTKLEKTKTGYYEANQGFATTLDGEQLFVQKGELVHKSHPLLKGREDLFDPADRISRLDVEQASAGPGEKRGRRRKSVS